MEYLIACVDNGSVAGAAQQLNVSAPTISLAMSKVEQQLGVQLLLRHHSQGVTPTAVAQNMLPSARSLLAHATDLQKAAQSSGADIAGDVRIGSFVTLAPVVLPRLIETLATDFPSVSLRITEGTQEVVLKALMDGQIDVALVYDIDLPKTVRRVELAQLSPYVALPKDHALARQAKVFLSQLEPEPMILLDVPPSREYFLGLFHSAGLRPRVAHSSPSLELVRGMVGRGLGYSILVTRPPGDQTYDGNDLVIRPLGDDVAKSKIVLASRSDLRPTKLISCVEAIAQRVGKQL